MQQNNIINIINTYQYGLVKRIEPSFAIIELPSLNATGFLHISNATNRKDITMDAILKINQEVVVKIFQKSPSGYKLSLKDIPKNITSNILKKVHQNQQIKKLFEIAGKNAKIPNFNDYFQKLEEEYGDKLIYLFKEAAEKGTETFKEAGLPLNLAENLAKLAQAKFKKKEVVISKKVRIESKKSNGLTIIKNALQEVEKKGYDIKYIGGKYEIKTKTTDPKNAEKEIENLLHGIRKKVDVCEILLDAKPVKKC